MSFTLTQVEQLCLDLTGSINQSSCLNDTANYGFLNLLRSSRNARLFTVNGELGGPKGAPIGGENGSKTIKLNARAPICDDIGEKTACVKSVCDVNPEAGYKSRDRSFILTIEQCDSEYGAVSEDQFDSICQDPQSYFRDEIAEAAQRIKRRVNRAAIAYAWEQLGSYDKAGTLPSQGDGNTKILPIYSDDGSVQPQAFVKAKQIYRRLGITCPIIGVGGYAVEDYVDVYNATSNLPCCNADGKRPNFSGLECDYDYEFDDVINGLQGTEGKNYKITFPTGVLGFVTYNNNLGYKRKRFEDCEFTTIEIGGCNFDFEWIYDKCTRTWKWLLKLNYDFCCYPQELLCNADKPIHLWQPDCGNLNCEFWKC